MKGATASRPYPLLVLGAVRGLVSEAPQVTDALSKFRPDVLALGLSPEEVRALQEHFADPRFEPWVPLAPSEVAQARGLSSFGTVRVPSPSHLAALGWASGAGTSVVGAEPSDDVYGTLFVEHVGSLDLLRRTLAERSLSRDAPEAESAEAYALAWDARSQKGRGSERLLKARLDHQMEVLRELCSSPGATVEGRRRPASLKNRVAVLVDVERFGDLVSRLTSELRESWEPLLPAPVLESAGPLPSEPQDEP